MDTRNSAGSFGLRRWTRIYVLLVALLVAFVASLGGPLVPPRASAHADTAFLRLATQRPQAQLRVIIQKQSSDDSVEREIRGLGGNITSDLPIINGFSATVPAAAINRIAHDARVRWISPDGPVRQSVAEVGSGKLQNAYIRAINADKVWNQTTANYQGQNIGVAIIDSGIIPQQDVYTKMGRNRLVANIAFNNGYNRTVYDGYGHGTHVAGIVGGNGSRSAGAYIGVAPMVNLINVKVSDDNGAATTANVVNGLQWVYDNRAKYNIRVVNISLNGGTLESYHTSPLCAAVEILWFNKIVVVVSAGNNGTAGALYPPANDPFAITVGATDDKGTTSITDDTIASFSAYGQTKDGIAKPDLVAPGKNIVSMMANANSVLAKAHPANMAGPNYFRMSGTSMAAPMVAGAAALMLQANPNLTPDQVKYRLKATARPFDTATRAGAGYLDVYGAVTSTATQNANTGLAASKFLWTGSQPLAWSSPNWDSASWSTASWSTASWSTASWSTASWSSDYWGK